MPAVKVGPIGTIRQDDVWEFVKAGNVRSVGEHRKKTRVMETFTGEKNLTRKK